MVSTRAWRPGSTGEAVIEAGRVELAQLREPQRVVSTWALDRQVVRKELRARGIGRLEIEKRGVDLDPARYRARLGPQGDGEAVLIATRLPDRRAALLCSRV